MTDDPPIGESVMRGGGFYSEHSQAQRIAANASYAWLAAAAAAVPLPAPPGSLVIGDFGCAGGANEMAPLSGAIDVLRGRSADLPIEVVHTDLPHNDFGPLFALLESPDGYPHGRSGLFPSVVGRTLYGPLLPERRLHLGWSSITLHWLSGVPARTPGCVYSNLLPDGPIRDAFRAQSRADWSAFLIHRARELVDHGELVLVGGASEPNGASGAEGLFAMIQEQLDAMVSAGALRQDEADEIVYPTWNRTPDEWTELLEATGFELIEAQLGATDDAITYGDSPAGIADAARFADVYTPFVRAITELPFFRWLDARRPQGERAQLIDGFYEGLRSRIQADPRSAACRWHTMALRIRRRPRAGAAGAS